MTDPARGGDTPRVVRRALLALCAAALGCGDEPVSDLGARPLRVAPTNLRFGPVEAGETARAAVQVTNASDAPLSVEIADLPAFVRLSAPGPARLEPRATATFALTVTAPHAIAPSRAMGSATVRCAERADCATPLTLEAEYLPAGAWAVTPSALAFPSALVGRTTAATALLTNPTGRALEVRAEIVGPDAARFGVRPPRATVPPGGSVTLEVGYAPPDAAAHEATLVLVDADGQALEVPLTGHGRRPACRLEIAPGSLSFGVVAPDRALRRTVELRNLGADPCALTVTPRPPDHPALVDPRGPVALYAEAGETAPFTFVLDPAADLEGAEPLVRYAVEAEGAPAGELPVSWRTRGDVTLEVVPSEIDAGEVPRGCVARRRVQIFNPFEAPAQVRSATVTQAGFPLTHDPLPRALGPGESTAIEVALGAAPDGPSTATLVLRAERPDGLTPTFSVPLRYVSAPAGPCPD